MPLHQIKSLSPTSVLGLWRLEESIEELQETLLSVRPEHPIPSFKALSRTREWLVARVLAYVLLEELSAPPMNVETQETGEPVCSEANWRVSLTHSGDWVGALVSCSHQVGIDIELLGDKVPRLAPRFLNQQELEAADDVEKQHLYWSAKETLYKVYSHKKLVFKENLLLQGFSRQQAGEFNGRVVTDNFDQSYAVQYEVHPAFVLTYIVAQRQH